MLLLGEDANADNDREADDNDPEDEEEELLLTHELRGEKGEHLIPTAVPNSSSPLAGSVAFRSPTGGLALWRDRWVVP
jgi:hypothetical protein